MTSCQTQKTSSGGDRRARLAGHLSESRVTGNCAPMSSDSSSSKALYYIAEKGDRWCVRHRGAEYPYLTRAIAIGAAIDAARTSGARGHVAQVLGAGPDDAWVNIWTYGVDPYPPDD